MKIGFVGDIHGRVFHTLALLTAWQIRNQCKLDLIIQVGDLGAYPYPNEELKNEKYVKKDLAQLDFSRYLQAKGKLAENIQYIRTNHLEQIYFIRGNHEDFTWLRKKSSLAQKGTVCVDSFDLFYYATDGSVIKKNNLSIAFLGGIQTSRTEESIDEIAYHTLLNTNKKIDVLITHDAPFGIGTGYYGDIQGSTMISTLIKQLQPNYLIAGHYHHMAGPLQFKNTTYLGLSVLVNLRENDQLRSIEPGSMAVLDTSQAELRFVLEPWITDINGNFDFNSFVDQVRNGNYYHS
ncbi:metallophosphoesterase family protein [Shimazuella alba]|uniref:Calcineurin-like phosphoesterase domain-containing protein n=1 Tax=Shimazuella alba TaxID=2690964 RepID=A0A6I4VLU8_9BACL|nr:metallophosphoesterase [Shimazuella alba]MXQ52387.1 hypothetical protein [Shimazuella alba]